LFAISLGIFLFILFFNPFGLNNPDLNNQLLVILGLGGIVFFMMALFYVVIPSIFPELLKPDVSPEDPPYITGFIVWVLSSVSFAFYLRYVGRIELSFYMVFKAVVVCLAPVVVYWIIQTKVILRQQITLLNKKVERMQDAFSGQVTDKIREKVVIESENKSESLELRLSDIFLIRSADNYVEVVYLENGEIKRKLVRNTLKNVEKQLILFPDFLRCHRTTLINTGFVEKLYRSYSGVFIKLKGYEPGVPVSRQYLLKVKEITET
jgi:DNA-binding LytR/AlgR family response regulator